MVIKLLAIPLSTLISLSINPVTLLLKTNVAVKALLEVTGTPWITTEGRVAS